MAQVQLQEFDFEQLLKKQRDFFSTGQTRKIEFRLESLKKLEKTLRVHEIEIFAALNQDLGRCDFETYLAEVAYLYAEITHTKDSLADWMAPRPQNTPLALAVSSSYVLPVPLGQVLIISPWNYPLQLALAPLISAIAAGNTAVIKPSEFTPKTADILAKIIAEVFPYEFISVVKGGIAETTALLDLKWNHIFFTGSTQVGKVIAGAAAKKLIPVTLELGGKSPCIVHKDAHVKISAKRVAWGKFFNCGQTCISPDYLLVHEDVKARFIEELIKAINGFYGDNPIKSPDYGRIVSEKHTLRLINLVSEQKILFGGESDLAQKYIAPTLLESPKLDAQVMREEIFGPILPIYTYSQTEEIAPFVAQFPGPLSLYLFTKNELLQRDIIESISFGGGCINNTMYHFGSLNMPFGGIGPSGMGAYHGVTGFNQLSHLKSILKSSFRPDLPLRYPPYGKKIKLLKKLLPWLT